MPVNQILFSFLKKRYFLIILYSADFVIFLYPNVASVVAVDQMLVQGVLVCKSANYKGFVAFLCYLLTSVISDSYENSLQSRRMFVSYLTVTLLYHCFDRLIALVHNYLVLSLPYRKGWNYQLGWISHLEHEIVFCTSVFCTFLTNSIPQRLTSARCCRLVPCFAGKNKSKKNVKEFAELKKEEDISTCVAHSLES